jgi:methyl-accepting chemotaxis protein
MKMSILTLGSRTDAEAICAALTRSQAMVEFDLAGRITRANPSFCLALGYELKEIVGKHHRIFCEPAYVSSDAYRQFWANLSRGQFDVGEYKRIGKGNREVWIQATYSPIVDKKGRVFKVVKFAIDITERVRALDEIAVGLTALANGDRVTRIADSFIPTLERLRVAFNGSIEKLEIQARRRAERSSGVVRSTIQAMGEIDKLSREISGRIGVIDDVILQTNLQELERWCRGGASN